MNILRATTVILDSQDAALDRHPLRGASTRLRKIPLLLRKIARHTAAYLDTLHFRQTQLALYAGQSPYSQ
jgi:hypothetical protein